MSDKDLFEEFEFKPITSGLGFRSNRKNKSEKLSADLTASTIRTQLPSAESPEEKLPEITLPFKGSLSNLDMLDGKSGAKETSVKKEARNRTSVSQVETASAPTKVAEILGDLRKHRKQETTVSKKIEAVPLRACNLDLSALILDAMLVIAIALTCLIVLILVTEADLVQVVITSSQEMVLTSAGLLVAMISWSYLVLTRLFMGQTPGEWVFDQRLLKPEEEKLFSSRMKLLLRSTLVVATGFVLIPFLSFVFRKDLAGVVTGARLYRQAIG